MYDTIIIGAGMSGLAAGIRLAYYNQSVCILERHSVIGGMNSYYRLRGREHDVGLHAVTNFTPKGAKKGPLARLLRQLRVRWDDLSLAPQIGSSIAFPGVELAFNNDAQLLESEIAARFPAQIDNYRRLVEQMVDFDDIDEKTLAMSAREVVNSFITDPLLVEMLFCPLMWYGNAREHDMDWGQFCIMFRSIFLEGLARPQTGVRSILKMLRRKYRDLGGELKTRAEVERIHVDGDHAVGVVLADGTEIQGRRILSSAGWPETMRMSGRGETVVEGDDLGQMSFCEAISVLDRHPKQLGHQQTIVFFNDSPTFDWQKCDGLCDLRTGVICSPNNFVYDGDEHGTSATGEGVIRITAIANFDHWNELTEQQYAVEKMRWYDRIVDASVRFVPDFRSRVIDIDMFTPKTIRRFTQREGGAVYGAPKKNWHGTTHLDNLFICGTDQGFVGIVGAIMSGISIANQHLLRD